jgi:hypothetical protein
MRKALLAIAAVLLPASAWAGGHLEFGHWVVTSDDACVDNNRPEMDADAAVNGVPREIEKSVRQLYLCSPSR